MFFNVIYKKGGDITDFLDIWVISERVITTDTPTLCPDGMNRKQVISSIVDAYRKDSPDHDLELINERLEKHLEIRKASLAV